MAYQTGTASDQTDLINKTQIFAVANGFTLNYYSGANKHCSIGRAADGVYVSFAWDGVDTIAIYHALGYAGGSAEAPWNQADDSGNGSSTIPSQIDRGRQVSRIGAGSFTAYHFFAYTNPYNIHVVLEFSPGLYRHFGFGTVSKEGTWTGGQWCAGHLWNWANSFAVYSNPLTYPHSVLMDGATLFGQAPYSTYNNNSSGTLHVEALPGQDAASKWGIGVHNGNDDANMFNDRSGNPRIRIAGGCRQGPAITQYGPYLPDLANGFIPIIPMEMFYCREDNAVDGWYYLGRMFNIGHIHLHGIDVDQELTIGGDTWKCFPVVRKSNIGGTNQESENAGIIYKKVT